MCVLSRASTMCGASGSIGGGQACGSGWFKGVIPVEVLGLVERCVSRVGSVEGSVGVVSL